MNEIVGTLYFVLAHDSNEDWAKEAEADTYFLFNSIMVSICQVYYFLRPPSCASYLLTFTEHLNIG